MARAEVLAASRLVFLDGHVRVTKANQLDLIALLREHSKLLALARGSLGLVVAAEPFASVGDRHQYRR